MIYFYQQIKDRPGTDQTLKLVSYNSLIMNLLRSKKVRHFNVVLVHKNPDDYKVAETQEIKEFFS